MPTESDLFWDRHSRPPDQPILTGQVSSGPGSTGARRCLSRGPIVWQLEGDGEAGHLEAQPAFGRRANPRAEDPADPDAVRVSPPADLG